MTYRNTKYSDDYAKAKPVKVFEFWYCCPFCSGMNAVKRFTGADIVDCPRCGHTVQLLGEMKDCEFHKDETPIKGL